jgi:polar amino acid transport system substrate-binding protein
MKPCGRSGRILWLVISLWCSAVLPARAANFQLTTLEWAPYTGAALQGKGSISTTIVDAMKLAGATAEVKIFPWARAMRLVDTDPAYVGFFPAYYSRDRATRYLYSDPVGSSNVVFLERVDAPVKWATLDDLQGKRLGVVRGYVNTEELDARIAQKTLQAEEVVEDRSNVLKLAAGRLDLAVIDSQIYEHMVNTDPEVARVAPLLKVNPKVLEVKNLYVCFQRSPAGVQAQRALNTGLRKLQAKK